jgi:CheY-like chemotaxis protein
MAPEVLKRIFEPFFTTKPVGVGTGLGLSICHGIIGSAGGSLQAESRVGHGSSFCLELPLAKPSSFEPAPAAPEATPQRRGRVLVVDDEAMVLSTIGRILREHEPVCVDSPKQALELMANLPPFDVIFSDLMMPDMTGMDFYEELLRTRPEAARRVVFLSGGARNPRVKDFLAAVPNLRLEKPFRTETLKAIVQQVLASTEPR